MKVVLQGSPIVSRGLFGESRGVLELLEDEADARLELDVLLAVGSLQLGMVRFQELDEVLARDSSWSVVRRCGASKAAVTLKS